MNIVVAELEEKTIHELKNILPNLGHKICCIVTSGEEAVQKTLEIAPDLVIMDIDLKGEMKGVDAGRKIMEDYNIPVIFMTVFTKNCLTKSLQLPENAITVSKPLKQDHLKYAISIALDNL
ncbi:MAG: response regulator [Methanobacterium sp.]|nr:response regulator [Methanobacterium sp.]